MSDLKSLLERYRHKEPRRSTGGLHALAGFDFQLRAFLGDFVECLVRSEVDDGARDFTASLEGLSDYSRHHVVVQAKRTLTTSRLAEAGIELARLHRFLAEAGHGSEYRYEVVAQGPPDAPEWPAALATAPVRDADPELRTTLEELLGSRRLLPPRIEADPWWRLIETVFSQVDDPFGFARQALDLSLGRGTDPGGAKWVAERITELFTDQVRRRRDSGGLPGALLNVADVTPAAGNSREIVIGRIPTVRHLRDGCFAEREHRLRQLLDQLDSLVESRRRRPEHYLDVLWIDGQSGSGKSVLLLQLVRSLILERGERVLWLDDQSGALLPLLDRWQETADIGGGPLFVAVDDVYDPQGRDALDLRAVSHRVRSRPDVPWPILLTCGPPEFRERFKHDSRGENIQVSRWVLPPLDRDETEVLAHWYESRTGRPGHRGTAREEKQGLMVSVMFELAAADDLGSFAHRFADRLEASELEDSLRLPLALNRLYVWAPSSWLRREERDRLDRLNQEEDFTLLAAETIQQRYLKLTHPHLSDAVYKAVRPGPASIHSRDLAEAFGKALATDLNVANRILMAVAGGHERIASLDGEVLAEEMPRAWLDAGIEDSLPPHRAASFWGHWAVWASRRPRVAQALGVDVLDRAIEALERAVGQPWWGSLWLLLADAHPDNERLQELGYRWIDNATPEQRDRPDWSRVWESLADREQDPERTSRLFGMGWSWMKGSEARLDWNFVWQALLRHQAHLRDSPSLREVLQTGTRWVEVTSSERPDWCYVWQKLVDVQDRLETQQRDQLLELGWSWVRQPTRTDQPEWAHVWQKLVDVQDRLETQQREQLLELGWSWVRQPNRSDQPEWTHVWQKLVDVQDRLEPQQRDQLLELGWSWVRQPNRTDQPEWTHVWQKLVDVQDRLEPQQRDQLLELGWSWVRQPNRSDQPEWAHVWQKLVDVQDRLEPQQREQLLELGWSWVRQPTRTDQPEWNYVWRKLVDVQDRLETQQRDQLLELGWSWVRQPNRSDQPEWAHVWQKLVDVQDRLETQQRDQLLKLGLDWLDVEERRNDPEWTFVWQKLIGCIPSQQEDRELRVRLVDLARWWLQDSTNLRSDQWDKILEDGIRTGLDDAKVLAAGVDWCLGNLELPQTPVLAAKLLNLAPRGAHATRLAAWLAEWLQENSRQRRGVLLYQLLTPRPHKLPSPEVQVFGHLPTEWTDLRHALESCRATAWEHWSSLCQAYESGDSVVGSPYRRVKGGYLVGIFVEITAFLPFSESLKIQPAPQIGTPCRVQIQTMNPTLWNVVLMAPAGSQAPIAPAEAFMNRYEVGDRCTGVVTNVVEYGAFIRVDGFDGLLHRSEISGLDSDPVDSMLAFGQTVEVEISRMDKDQQRVWFRHPPTPTAPPEIA